MQCSRAASPCRPSLAAGFYSCVTSALRCGDRPHPACCHASVMTLSSSAPMTCAHPDTSIIVTELAMAGKMLSVEPTIDPTASVHDSKLGAYYRGRRAHDPARSRDGRLFLRRERRPDHLHHDRKILLDRGDDADQSGQSSDAARHRRRISPIAPAPIFRARATMPNSSHGGAAIASISAMTSGSATAPSCCRAAASAPAR